MVVCFLDFSCSFEFHVAVFTSEVAVNLSILLTSGKKYRPSPLLEILRLPQASCGFPCSRLLAPSCGRIFKALSLWVLKLARWSLPAPLFSQRWWYSSSVCSLPGPQVSAHFSVCSLAIFQSSPLLAHLQEGAQIDSHRVGVCGWGTGGAGSVCGSARGSVGGTLPAARVWWSSWWTPPYS